MSRLGLARCRHAVVTAVICPAVASTCRGGLKRGRACFSISRPVTSGCVGAAQRRKTNISACNIIVSNKGSICKLAAEEMWRVVLDQQHTIFAVAAISHILKPLEPFGSNFASSGSNSRYVSASARCEPGRTSSGAVRGPTASTQSHNAKLGRGPSSQRLSELSCAST